MKTSYTEEALADIVSALTYLNEPAEAERDTILVGVDGGPSRSAP